MWEQILVHDEEQKQIISIDYLTLKRLLVCIHELFCFYLLSAYVLLKCPCKISDSLSIFSLGMCNLLEF